MTPSQDTFLVLDDDIVFAQTLQRALQRRGFHVEIAHDGAQALALAEQTAFDCVTIDLHLAQPQSGIEKVESGLHVIPALRAALPDAQMLVLTGYASLATAVQAVKLGADDYLSKPASVDSILSALKMGASAQAAEDALEHPVPLSVSRLEWEHIQRVLAEHDGNISATARALNMHRRTLQRKLMKKPAKQ